LILSEIGASLKKHIHDLGASLTIKSRKNKIWKEKLRSKRPAVKSKCLQIKISNLQLKAC